VALSVASAVLFALTFPTPRWTALSWIAVAPLLVAVREGTTRQAFVLSWLWCVAGACAAGSWFPSAVAEYFHQSLAVALLLFVGVFSVMAAPYMMAFAAAYRALARRFGPLSLPLLAGAAWAAAELARGRLFSGTPFFIGNPWALAGYAHAQNLPLLQIASVTGIYGVSFAVACVNAAVAETWVARRRRRSLRPALLGLALSALPALAMLVYGHAILRRPAPGADSPPVEIALVQGNLSIGTRWRSDLYGRNLDIYLELTRAAAAQGRPAIVFWPEAAMTFFLEREPLYRAAIASVTRPLGVELVGGAPRAIGEDEEALYTNSIYSLAPDGVIRGRYDKQHLVPFAEYFPLRIDVMRRRFGRIRTFEFGKETEPIRTRAGPAGVLVCNEAMLPEVAAERVARGAVYLVNPSNDTWISDPQYTEQQLDIASLRAIEQRRYLVRVSTSGPSAVIDPLGRMLARTPPLEAAVARAQVRAVRDLSVYGRVGDLFGGACAAAVAGALALRRVGGRRP
jgi:apolipoprotein N-acyltransferase